MKDSDSSISIKKIKYYVVIGIMIFLLLERLMLVLSTENEMNLFSDDNGYINSAITYMKTHYITYYHYGTYAQKTPFIMPGMPWLLSLLFTLFGYDEAGMMWSRLFFSLFSAASAFFAYKIACRFFDPFTGVIALLLAGSNIPLISLSGVFLTETPYTFLFLGTMYFFIAWLDDIKKTSKYFRFLLFFTAQLFLKGIGLATPFSLILFIVMKIKEDHFARKPILRGVLFSLTFAFFCLLPWVIRNYNSFDRFILFTANLGDGKLRGTFQGYGYPEGAYEESMAKVNSVLSQTENTDPLARFDLEDKIATERLSQWFHDNPLEFIYTHILWKPWNSIRRQYYPYTIFNISTNIADKIWNIFLIFSAGGVFTAIFKAFRGKEIKGLVLCVSLLFLLLYTSVFYSDRRYSAPYVPLIFIYSAYGISQLVLILFKLHHKIGKAVLSLGKLLF